MTPSELEEGRLKIVALHIPKFQRGKEIKYPEFVPHVAIMESGSPVLLEIENVDLSTSSDYNIIFSPLGSISNIRMPDEIEFCGPSIITCVDPALERNPKKLIIMLFLQGFGNGVLKEGQYFEYSRKSPIQDVQELRLSELELASVHQMSFNAQYPFTTTNSAGFWKNPNEPAPGQSSQGHIKSLDCVQHSVGQSPLSNFSSPASFMTANSPASFMTARSTYTSPAPAVIDEHSSSAQIATKKEDELPAPSLPIPFQQLHVDYYQGLRSRKIFQPFDKELNWSGKGQHVTFKPQEDVPLTFLSHLGSSMTATVEKVLCRRIALARKTMRCSRQLKVTDALIEVYHLQNLRHAHIVQLVGSYLQGRQFSILLYPVANYHLGQFLEDTSDIKDSLEDIFKYDVRVFFLKSTFSCLASAISFVHEHTTKHMDIKPQNILVKSVGPSIDPCHWRLYIADFGLSRSFASQGHSQTDGPTARTPRYCAPEVFKFEKRGLAADIFSLGCVYLEIMTILNALDLQDFANARRGPGQEADESFHANLGRVSEWIDNKLKTFT